MEIIDDYPELAFQSPYGLKAQINYLKNNSHLPHLHKIKISGVDEEAARNSVRLLEEAGFAVKISGKVISTIYLDRSN